GPRRAACDVLMCGLMTTLAAIRPRPAPPSPAESRAAGGLHPLARRALEGAPPAVAWIGITSPAWAAILAPQVLGYFLVAFSAYWVWRSAEFTAGLLIGLRRMHLAQQRDWLAAGNRLPGFEQLHHL